MDKFVVRVPAPSGRLTLVAVATNRGSAAVDAVSDDDIALERPLPQSLTGRRRREERDAHDDDVRGLAPPIHYAAQSRLQFAPAPPPVGVAAPPLHRAARLPIAPPPPPPPPLLGVPGSLEEGAGAASSASSSSGGVDAPSQTLPARASHTLWGRLRRVAEHGCVDARDARDVHRRAVAAFAPVPVLLWGADGPPVPPRGGGGLSRRRVTALAFDADGILLLAGGGDGRLRLWNCDSVAAVRVAVRSAAAVNSTVRLSGVPGVRALHELLAPGPVTAAAWHPTRDSDVAVATATGGDLLLYDMETLPSSPTTTLTRAGDALPSPGGGGGFAGGNTAMMFMHDPGGVGSGSAPRVPDVGRGAVGDAASAAKRHRGVGASGDGDGATAVGSDEDEDDRAPPSNVGAARSGADFGGASGPACILAGDGDGRVRLWDSRIKQPLRWTVAVGATGAGGSRDVCVRALLASSSEVGVVGAATACGVVAQWDVRRLVRGTLAPRAAPAALRTFDVVRMAEAAAADAVAAAAAEAGPRGASLYASAGLGWLTGAFTQASAWPRAARGTGSGGGGGGASAAAPIVQHALPDPVAVARTHFLLSNGWVLGVDDDGVGTAERSGGGGGGGPTLRRMLPPDGGSTLTSSGDGVVRVAGVAVPPLAACFVIAAPRAPRATRGTVAPKAGCHPHALLLVAQSRAGDAAAAVPARGPPLPVAAAAAAAALGDADPRLRGADPRRDAPAAAAAAGSGRTPCVAVVDVWPCVVPPHHRILDSACSPWRAVAPPGLDGASATALAAHPALAGLVVVGHDDGDVVVMRA